MEASSPIIELSLARHAQDLRETWQARILSRAVVVDRDVARPRDLVGMCALSVLAHNYDDAMQVLLLLCGAHGVGLPSLCTAAKVAKTGHVMADYINKFGSVHKNQGLFRNTKAMETAFRRLADQVKLTDAERIELFAAVRRWVVCDYRLDPTMDRHDPDAKRLTVN